MSEHDCPTCGAELTCRSCRWRPEPINFGGLCNLPDAKPYTVDPSTRACAAFERRQPAEKAGAPSTRREGRR